MNLSDRMKNEAVSLGLCAQWTAEWKDNTSKEEMIDKYIRGIDFCIEHNYPSNEEIKEYFGEKIHEKGIYVDEKAVVQSERVLVINGKCDIQAAYNKFDAADIYLRHTSKLKLIAKGLSRITVEIYDNSELEIEQDEYSKVFVYQHGGTVKHNGHAIIRDRRK